MNNNIEENDEISPDNNSEKKSLEELLDEIFAELAKKLPNTNNDD